MLGCPKAQTLLAALGVLVTAGVARATAPVECGGTVGCDGTCEQRVAERYQQLGGGQTIAPLTATCFDAQPSVVDACGRAVPDDAGPIRGCLCRGGSGSSYHLAPQGAAGCIANARDMSCVYEASEFPGCDPAVADSCDAVCDVLRGRLQAVEDRIAPVSLHGGVCNSGMCECVIASAGRCYATSGYGYDCSLSAREIYETSAAEHSPLNDCGGCAAVTAPSGALTAIGLLLLAARRRRR